MLLPEQNPEAKKLFISKGVLCHGYTMDHWISTGAQHIIDQSRLLPMWVVTYIYSHVELRIDKHRPIANATLLRCYISGTGHQRVNSIIGLGWVLISQVCESDLNLTRLYPIWNRLKSDLDQTCQIHSISENIWIG